MRGKPALLTIQSFFILEHTVKLESGRSWSRLKGVQEADALLFGELMVDCEWCAGFNAEGAEKGELNRRERRETGILLNHGLPGLHGKEGGALNMRKQRERRVR